MTLTRDQLDQAYREEVVSMDSWAAQWLEPEACIQLAQDSFSRLLVHAITLTNTLAGPLWELYDIANRIVSSWVVAGAAKDDLPLWLDLPDFSADRQLRFTEVYCTVVRATHRAPSQTTSSLALQEPLRRDIAYLLGGNPDARPQPLSPYERSHIRRLLDAAEGATTTSRQKESFLTQFCDREVRRTYLGRGERVPQTRSEPHGENE